LLLVLLTGVLASDYADRYAVGALAPAIKSTFGIDNTDIGILAATFSVVGALGTLPAGMLADRIDRTRLLAGAVAVWSLAATLSGAAVGFGMLVGARVLLGAITAVAGPATASLVGDAYPARARSRALGIVLSGELAGGALGLSLSSGLLHFASWRYVFFVLAAAGALLAPALWRLREPKRSGRTTLGAQRRESPVLRLVEKRGVRPDRRLVLRGDLSRLPLWAAARDVLRIRTFSIVLVASSLGFFFFAGVRTFSVVYLVQHYGVSHSLADLLLIAVGVGAVIGLVLGGRTSDWLIGRGHANGRLAVAIGGYLLAVAAFPLALMFRSFPAALPFYMLGAAGVASPGPTLDAMRLDVVHPQLWGRAEATRTVLRVAAEALGPIVFGVLADTLGVEDAFLISLPALAVSAAALVPVRRFYLREAAAAAASVANSR
jgi:predicted MFS family arabinose efflux permease